MSRDETDSSESESGDEVVDFCPPILCLFCANTTESMDLSFEHIKKDHNFNVETFLKKNVTSTYDLIKIITYIRKKGLTPVELEAPGRPWDSEEYLAPVDSSDPWLWTDFEFIDDDDTEPKYVNSENGIITLSKDHFDELQKRNQELQLLVDEKDKQMQKLRNLLNENDTNPKAEPRVAGDESYFGSYSSFEIHREMLADVPRMDAFKKLFDEKHLFDGKFVLDVGCGTGILSMMAASAGASSVVGVDESEILYTGIEIIHENGFDSVIKLVKGKVEMVELNEKFDVIVSEWMGYFLLFEGMLSSVITARNRFLKEGGHIFPSNCTIYIAGVSDENTRKQRVECEVYGFKMTPLQKAALREASIETVPAETVATESFAVHRINVLTAEKEDCYFTSNFSLVSTRLCTITSICGWFDSGFEPSPSMLSTSPSSPQTHWKQTIFYLEKPISVQQGDTISGMISAEPAFEGSRSLVINLTLNNVQQTYNLA